jgi:Secretion system C-terminal sorting domain/FG-GAP-like repeat
VLTNTGTGAFGAPVNYSVSNDPSGLTIGDMNGDNRPDLIVAYTSSYISVLNNLGDGFESGRNYTVAPNQGLETVVIANLNNDGRPDLAGVSTDIFTLLNTTISNSQTISFAALNDKTYGDAVFELTAEASSSLPVVYTSSNTAVATIDGNNVTIVGVGTTTIEASQSGGGFYASAPAVEQSLTVNKANQAITFTALVTKTLGDATFDLTATTSSELAISYSSSNTAVATVSGNTVTIVGVGSTTITASQSGNDNYNAATAVEQSLTVNKANQTITFAALANKTFGDAAFDLTAGASSDLGVTYTSSNTAVATVDGNTVTIVGAGNTTITASQSGNDNYTAATAVEQSLTVNKANQTITFAALPAKTIGDANFMLNATTSSSLSVTYTSNDKVTINGSQVTLINPGRATISAVQEGNNNYAAAATVEQTFCVHPVKPVVTENFSNPTAPVLTSSASSGNQWYKNNELVSGATGNTYTITTPGAYTVIVTVEGCASEQSSATTAVITDLEGGTSSMITLYPNPAERQIEILFSETGEKQIEIIDAHGTVMHQEAVIALKTSVDIDEYSTGLYIVKIQTATKSFIKRFIKK